MSTHNLRSLVDALENALGSFIDDEQERVVAERDFLLAVYDGRTDGVNLENVSSELTEVYLADSLEQYIPIEEDDDGSG